MVHDGVAAVGAAEQLRPDVVVLDVMLPGLDGHEVCRRIQAQRPVPVLMLTARDDETDMLVGLGVGADDYMTKPFSHARAGGAGQGAAAPGRARRRDDRRARSRRRRRAAPGRPRGRPRASAGCAASGELVHLTPTEFDLLLCLAADARVVLTRERLLAEVWDWVDASGTRTVDSHVKALRRKLGADLIRTVHGVGYALEPVEP